MTTSLSARFSRRAGAPDVSAPHTGSISSTAPPRFVHWFATAGLLQRPRTTPKRPRPIGLRLAPAFSRDDPDPDVAPAAPGSHKSPPPPPAQAAAAAGGGGGGGGC